ERQILKDQPRCLPHGSFKGETIGILARMLVACHRVFSILSQLLVACPRVSVPGFSVACPRVSVAPGFRSLSPGFPPGFPSIARSLSPGFSIARSLSPGFRTRVFCSLSPGFPGFPRVSVACPRVSPGFRSLSPGFPPGFEEILFLQPIVR
ncbi:MAG: hypothetical protein ACI814_002031, partial [Mariniblastus sp.]